MSRPSLSDPSIHTVSGRAFDTRHPEMIKVLKSHVLVFKTTGETSEIPVEWEGVSLMLAESLLHLGVGTAS